VRGASLVAVGVAIAFSAIASRADATENEHHLGVDIGASALKVDDKSTLSIGGGGGAHWSYGLNDTFNLMAEGAFSLVALNQTGDDKTPRTRPASVSHLVGGVGYTLDVLTWVPYFGVLVGGFAMSGGTIDGTLFLPGAQLALGLDYKLSHHWSVGAALRQTMMLTHTSTYPSYSNLFARVEYVWGW
jgi:hypothetical protein